MNEISRGVFPPLITSFLGLQYKSFQIFNIAQHIANSRISEHWVWDACERELYLGFQVARKVVVLCTLGQLLGSLA